ncbi:LAS seventeen-binding protein 3 [Seminavis robusta]|uniref:LAS seventeen-binding protein 3 n=1 Tax=Seminavis robusta TaxID=568900 RepID=A0A9N8F3A3_9STRA|nr:LAS seventeen-binding protein 3 [Seminavis robusta]|eukprot:Sro3041_g342650.1 LAS seventeen-binding protein 3 (264) ;mRNA; f:4071-4998
MPEKRPKRITMPGMIYDANEVLGWAMDPNTGGLHPELFGPSLLGIAFITIVEAGFVFSGNVGTGIVMARNTKDGSWSPPSALGVSGIGWGFIMGASVKNIVYLIYDSQTLKSFSGDVGVKVGTQVEATIANWGRTAEATTMITNKGVGVDICLSYSRGIFGGLSIEGALLNPRPKVNEKFYGQEVTPKEILFDGKATLPDGTLMPEVYAKLKALCSGEGIYELTEAEKKKAASVREAAEKEGEEHVKEEKVEYVKVEEEAKKE